MKIKCNHNVLQFSEIVSGARLNVVDGEIKWHLANFTPDMDKYKVILAFEQAFAIWQEHFHPVKIVPTSEVSEAQIILNFATNGSVDLPIRFDVGTLAYAFAPTNGTSGVWINEEYQWASMHKPNMIDLKKVIVHELGHSFNLGHSADITDIMYPAYQPNSTVTLTEDTVDGIKTMYAEHLTPDDTDEYIVDFIRELFPTKYRLRRLSEKQLLVIADELDIEATIKDLKRKTRDKIYNRLHR
tara:strand:- start:13500 stop:14225 length:726 start_codon:yes stop_codon:yes gene_type:complete